MQSVNLFSHTQSRRLFILDVIDIDYFRLLLEEFPPCLHVWDWVVFGARLIHIVGLVIVLQVLSGPWWLTFIQTIVKPLTSQYWILNPVSILLCQLINIVLWVWGWLLFGWISFWIPILSFPASPHKPSRMFKVSCVVKMFFSALNFSLHATPSCTPLSEQLNSLFIPSLVLQLFVLMVVPNLLHLLLMGSIWWIVWEIVGLASKGVLRREFYLLFIVCEKALLWGMESGSFSLFEILGKGWCHLLGGCLGRKIVLHRQGDIIGGTQVWC